MNKRKRKLITLIAEEHAPSAVAMYKSLGPVYFLPDLKLAEREAILKKANILATGLSINVYREFIDQMPNLKVVATQTTGLNHIDVLYLKSTGRKLISLRGRTSFLKNIPSTAEETMALLLALVRKLPWAFDHVKAGGWNRLEWRGNQLMGKTIGLLGFGRLGKIVARYERSFGMKVIAADPFVSKNSMEKRGVKKVGMDKIFKSSDIVSLHVLLTDNTYNLVKEKHLKMMRPHSFLINTARAELIERGALVKALKNKWIAGAAVDVLWDERPDGGHLKTSPEWKYAKENNNLLIVPHIGGATFEAMAKTQEFIANEVLKYFSKK